MSTGHPFDSLHLVSSHASQSQAPAAPPAQPRSEIDEVLDNLDPKHSRAMTNSELEALLRKHFDNVWLHNFEAEEAVRNLIFESGEKLQKQLNRYMAWTVVTSIVVPVLAVFAAIKLI